MKSRFAPLAVLVLFAGLSPVVAENRYYIPDTTLVASDDLQSFQVRGDNDVTILGYSIAFSSDPSVITLEEVTAPGSVGEGADFFEVSIDAEAGLIGLGCVFDLGGDFSDQKLDPGTGRVFANVGVRVLATDPTSTSIVLEDAQLHPDRPAVRNVMTNESGTSIKPSGAGDLHLTLENGTLSVVTFAPFITSIAPESAQAGETVTVTGGNFDQPDLTVEVCGLAANHTLVGDAGAEIEVEVPECPTAGLVPLEICTSEGCANDPEAFEFVVETEGGQFIRGDTDDSGGLDLTDGIRILNFLFLGGVDSRCRDAMDSNDSSSVDLADGVYIFQFLFLGGPEPPAPYPTSGTDPTADGLPECTS